MNKKFYLDFEYTVNLGYNGHGYADENFGPEQFDIFEVYCIQWIPPNTTSIGPGEVGLGVAHCALHGET